MKRWVIIGTAAVAAAVAIFAVLSLTGGSKGSELAQAAENIDGQSMRMKMKMDMTIPEGAVKMDGTGISSADGTQAQLWMDTIPEGVDAQVIRMELRGIRDDMWMRSKDFAGFMPPGKKWVHMVDDTTASETLTPSEFAKFLAGADDVSVVNENEDVNGKPTTHYKGVVDVLELADEIGGETEERFERMFGGGKPTIGIEAWIDREGMPVRIRVLSRDDSGNSIDMTCEVVEYGVPVNVEEPPAEQTIEEAEFDKLTE